MPASPVDTLRSWLFQKKTAGCRVRVIDYNIHKLSCHSSKFQREKANYGLSVLRGFGEEVERSAAPTASGGWWVAIGTACLSGERRL
jgi:hypothetical protein